MDSAMQNKEIIRRFVEAGNSRDFGSLEAIVAPTFVRECPATPDVVVRSFDDFRHFLEMDAQTFPDNLVEVHEMVAEGDRVALWATYTGTQKGPMGPFPPSGKRMACEFAGIFRVRGERIAHLRVVWDNVSILTQLGHFPPPGGVGA